MNNLIDDSQLGIRSKHSCLTRMLDFFAKVMDTYDTNNNKQVANGYASTNPIITGHQTHLVYHKVVYIYRPTVISYPFK